MKTLEICMKVLYFLRVYEQQALRKTEINCSLLINLALSNLMASRMKK